MAIIKINTENLMRGRVSISRKKQEDDSIVVYGILSTHDYIESIHTIETERYLLLGVQVFQEDFGTNDYDIKYSFSADNLVIKDDYVPDEVKVLIEYELYKDEDKEYFHADNFEEAIEIYNELVSSDEGDDEDYGY